MLNFSINLYPWMENKMQVHLCRILESKKEFLLKNASHPNLYLAQKNMELFWSSNKFLAFSWDTESDVMFFQFEIIMRYHQNGELCQFWNSWKMIKVSSKSTPVLNHLEHFYKIHCFKAQISNAKLFCKIND